MLPKLWSFEELLTSAQEHTVMWCTEPVLSLAQKTFPCPIVEPLSALPEGTQRLIVCGGGTLLDATKVWVHEHAPSLEWIAVPSMWGSGAEVSPIAVRNIDGKKDIQMGEHLLPTARAYWPEVIESLPEELVVSACGDTWSHALEGFLSPLASDALRHELAELIRLLLTLPIERDVRWFEASAQACAGQARSSVGLVHGVAHVLEGPLTAEYPHESWGHARLCSLFLLPVMTYNAQQSEKWEYLMSTHQLDGDAVLAHVRAFFKVQAYNRILPFVETHWRTILRDPCSRTNSVLVRMKQLDFFLSFAQQEAV